MNNFVKVLAGDCLESMRQIQDKSINCCVTSPPYYGLRDYGHDDQIGLEETPELYIANMVKVFAEVKRILRDDGTLWLNISDSYSSSARRVQSYDTYDKGEQDCQGHGSLSQSLYDVRKGVLWNRIGCTDSRRVLEQAHELCRQIQENMLFLIDHLPTEDCLPQKQKGLSLTAILDQVQNAIHVVEQLHGVLLSTNSESLPPLQGFQKPSDAVLAFLSSLRSFFSYALRYESMLGAVAETFYCNQDTALLCEELLNCTRCTYGYCLLVSSWFNHSYVKPQCTIPTVKNKDLIGIPWILAFALRADGWYLRQDIIWHKPNPMPESVKDRCTKAHEYIFLLSKKPKYYFDSDAIGEPLADASIARLSQNIENQTGSSRVPGKTNGNMKAVKRRPNGVNRNRELGYNSKENNFRTKENLKNSTTGLSEADLPEPAETRNKRSVWTVTTKPYKGAHFATFPPDLIEPCILAGCPVFGTVIDPFGGSGTVGGVAAKHNRFSILCELNPDYITLINDRVNQICK